MSSWWLDLSYPRCTWIQPFSATPQSRPECGRPGLQAAFCQPHLSRDSGVPVPEASMHHGMTKPIPFTKTKMPQDWTCKCLCSYNLCKHLLPLCGKRSPFKTVSDFKERQIRPHVFVLNASHHRRKFSAAWNSECMKNAFFFLTRSSWWRINKIPERDAASSLFLSLSHPLLHLFLDSPRSGSGAGSHLYLHFQIWGGSFSGLAGLGQGWQQPESPLYSEWATE